MSCWKSLLLPILLLAQSAYAGLTQRTVEAEQVSGGTALADLDASGGSAVTRSTTGIYGWWVGETTGLSTGSYSLYARISLAKGTTTAQSFGPQIFYGSQQIGGETVLVGNKEYSWIRITSFNLTQIGEQLRVSDWSSAGMRLDKLAIVKDVFVEAESVAGGTVTTDALASGGRAVTRSTDGIYVWWNAPTADMVPGDYEVFVRLRSADGASAGHNYTSYVKLDATSLPTASAVIGATTYQWVRFNQFTYAGGSQTVLISDYSQQKLNVDALRLVRRTPYDRYSGAQALFAAGASALCTPGSLLCPSSEVVFSAPQPPNNGQGRLVSEGRTSVVQKDANTIYAYFRQRLNPEGGAEIFQIFMATSTDGGQTFTVSPQPIIPVSSTLITAYDPQVTKIADNSYYMVFEGYGNGCGFSSFSARSTNGIDWEVVNVPVCGLFPPHQGSASTPNYFVDKQTNTQYIQWVSVDDELEKLTRHYQATLPNGLFSGRLTFSSNSEMTSYMLPQAPAGSWEDRNFGAGTVYHEDGYFYLVYEGANQPNCTGQWGLGIARTATPWILSSWTRSAKNPYLLAGKADSCWIGYPTMVMLPGGLYLYYSDPLTYWSPDVNTREIFRRLILPN